MWEPSQLPLAMRKEGRIHAGVTRPACTQESVLAHVIGSANLVRLGSAGKSTARYGRRPSL
eukprot:624356-Pleurochrysis_carterae.AAC.2